MRAAAKAGEGFIELIGRGLLEWSGSRVAEGNAQAEAGAPEGVDTPPEEDDFTELLEQAHREAMEEQWAAEEAEGFW